MKAKNKELTKAEEQIMQVIWKLEKAFVKDIIDELPEPKPAYTTVATITRILEEKGFLEHESFGRSYCYSPTIKKSTYRNQLFKSMFSNYFNGNPESLLSHFMKDNKLSLEEMDELLKKMRDDD